MYDKSIMNTVSIFIFSFNAIMPLILLILSGYWLKRIQFINKEFLKYAVCIQQQVKGLRRTFDEIAGEEKGLLKIAITTYILKLSWRDSHLHASSGN